MEKSQRQIAVNQDRVNTLYERLWREYIDENPELKSVLVKASGLSDTFGQAGHSCQATILWKIRTELYESRVFKFADENVLIWVSVCNTHQSYDKDCETCQAGFWQDYVKVLEAEACLETAQKD